jgi:succinoglycan biosynthesis transport protein ExoP
MQSMSASAPEFTAGTTLAEQINVVTGFVRRRYLAIVICVLASLVIGAVFLYSASPIYTASATMMIETPKDLALPGTRDAPLDTAWIESQIQILKSQNVAAYVVKQLHLADDPEFAQSGAGLWDKVLKRLGWGPPAPTSDGELAAVATGVVMSQLVIRRIGPSYLIQIDFRSHNRDQAAKVANAIIDGYIFDQLNAKYQANRRASDWLQDRLQALREQAAAAERAVIEFKAKNNIVATSGSLMNEKQLGETTGQLATTRDRVSDLQARLDRTEAVRQAYQTDRPTSAADGTISDELSNTIINGLRTKYLDLVNREADWSAKYGENHIAVVNLRNQIRDIRRSIYDELGRIEESYRSDYAIAKKRQDEIEKSLAGLISQSQDTNQAQVTLFSLDAAAKSYRKLYDDFLQRHTESVQQQSYPISDARPVSSAVAEKSYPRAPLVWLVAVGAGCMLGIGFGALQEMMDRGFRTREQVRAVLDRECLALVPLITELKASRQTARKVGRRRISTVPLLLQSVINAPSSPYSEAIRSVRLGINFNAVSSSGRVLGVTSCVPGEGKSSVAGSMAALLAKSGASVLLVDCDARNPSLSSALAPEAQIGVLDWIAGRDNLAAATWRDPGTSMAFLPMIANRNLPPATELFASEAAKSLFASLQPDFDYVILDLPPLISEIDIRASWHLVDAYILVVQWGATKIDAVQYALRHAPKVQEKMVGAVLNKVNIATLGRYDSYGASYYSSRYYNRLVQQSWLVN